MSGITQVYLHYNPGASGREKRENAHTCAGDFMRLIMYIRVEQVWRITCGSIISIGLYRYTGIPVSVPVCSRYLLMLVLAIIAALYLILVENSFNQ